MAVSLPKLLLLIGHLPLDVVAGWLEPPCTCSIPGGRMRRRSRPGSRRLEWYVRGGPRLPLRCGPDPAGSQQHRSPLETRDLNVHSPCLTPQAGLVLVPQLQDPDLGARLHHAMAHAFAAGHLRVAVVGTDVPDLTASLVARALATLDTHQASALTAQCSPALLSFTRCFMSPSDNATSHRPHLLQAAFGPAEDGGYYLLALTSLPPGLFQVRAKLLCVTSATTCCCQHAAGPSAPCCPSPTACAIAPCTASAVCWMPAGH